MNWDIDSDKDFSPIDGVTNFEPRVKPKPEGGHKVCCSICSVVFKSKPDDSKSYVEYAARANGWKGTRGKKAWLCPEHKKVKI